MVYLSSLEEWQKQSSLLLQARPSTTRITTKYNIPNLESPRYKRPAPKTRAQSTEAKAVETDRAPRAILVLKTYDTASGVVLHFKTDRAADIARLIAGLGTLGRHMAALPEKVETQDVTMHNTEEAVESIANDTKTPQQPQTSTGGGKKKKKGKR